MNILKDVVNKTITEVEQRMKKMVITPETADEIRETIEDEVYGEVVCMPSCDKKDIKTMVKAEYAKLSKDQVKLIDNDVGTANIIADMTDCIEERLLDYIASNYADDDEIADIKYHSMKEGD